MDEYFDPVISSIADYVVEYQFKDEHTFDLARYHLMDSVGCAMLALKFPECTKYLGPVVPETIVPNGSRVFGTQFVLDPIKSAFDTACLIGWISFNDYCIQSKSYYPSMNIAAILAVADYISRQRNSNGYSPLVIKDVLAAIIQSYEIQHSLMVSDSTNSRFNPQDFVKVSCAAVTTHMLGGNKRQIMHAVSQAFIDGVTLQTNEVLEASSTHPLCFLADAVSRGVQLALITMTGESGSNISLSKENIGFYDTFCDGKNFEIQRELGESAIEKSIFNLSFPMNPYFICAYEAAVRIHSLAKDKLANIEKIEFVTDKNAFLKFTIYKDVERTDLGLFKLSEILVSSILYGGLEIDTFASIKKCDERIGRLSELVVVKESEAYTEESLHSANQMTPWGVTLFYSDGSHSEFVEVSYPLGHPQRRADGIAFLQQKFESNLQSRFPAQHAREISSVCGDRENFEGMKVNEFMDLLVI